LPWAVGQTPTTARAREDFPDALGPMGYAPTYAGVANDIRRSATGPHLS